MESSYLEKKATGQGLVEAIDRSNRTIYLKRILELMRRERFAHRHSRLESRRSHRTSCARLRCSRPHASGASERSFATLRFGLGSGCSVDECVSR